MFVLTPWCAFEQEEATRISRLKTLLCLFVCSSSSSGEATIQIATVAEAGDEGIRVKKNLRVPAEFSKNSTGATKGLRGEEETVFFLPTVYAKIDHFTKIGSVQT